MQCMQLEKKGCVWGEKSVYRQGEIQYNTVDCEVINMNDNEAWLTVREILDDDYGC